MRQLASIQKIEDIRPIPNYDKIGLAKVLGWQVIVQLENFDIGDLCVYVEIDSVLPEKPEFEFLRKKKFRIKTMKMAKVVSQGICFPLDILPKKNWNVGDDVTDVIGVTKYEPDVANRNPNKKGSPQYPKWMPRWLLRFEWFRKLFFKTKRDKAGFPRFISKTDETRIQNLPMYLGGTEHYVAHEKLDGQSITVFLEKKKSGKFDFGVCSRNLRIWKENDSPWWFVVKKYDLEYILKNLFGFLGAKHFIAIQGEVISPQAQGNKYKVNEPELYVFNFFIDGRYLQPKGILSSYGIKWCPVVYSGFQIPDTIDELMTYTDGKSLVNPDVLREGLVFRNKDNSVSFKCVSNKFLLKHNL